MERKKNLAVLETGLLFYTYKLMFEYPGPCSNILAAVPIHLLLFHEIVSCSKRVPVPEGAGGCSVGCRDKKGTNCV